MRIPFALNTRRLKIAEFTPELAESVHLLSLDADNQKFMPDELFNTIEDAAETIKFLMTRYENGESPLVYPIFADNNHIGHIEAVKISHGWEIGYHIGERYRGRGYASEAVKAFSPVIIQKLGLICLYGICDAENSASRRVLEKSGYDKIYDGRGQYQGAARHIMKYIYY